MADHRQPGARPGPRERVKALVVFPIVLGPEGREPMFAGYPVTTFELVSSSVLDGRLLLLEYRPSAR